MRSNGWVVRATHLMSSSLAKMMTPRALEVSISLLMILSNSPGFGSLGIFMDCAIHRPPRAETWGLSLFCRYCKACKTCLDHFNITNRKRHPSLLAFSCTRVSPFHLLNSFPISNTEATPEEANIPSHIQGG